MKRLLNILAFIAISSFCFAQDNEMVVIDSLRNAMEKQEGVSRVETMVELARAMFDVSYDDCISIGEAAIAEAEKLGDEDLLSWAHWKIGNSFMDHYDFDLAYEHFETALDLLDGKEVSEWLMGALDYKGRMELFMGDLDAALETYQYDLQVSEKLGDELNCADVINNLACIHYQYGDLDKALECFTDARQRYDRAQDTLSMAQCDNNISNIYVEWQQYDEAMALLRKAIVVFEQNEDEASLAHAYQNMGTIYATGIVNLDSAMFYLHKAVACAENEGDQMTLAESQIELANVLILLNRDKEAVGLYQSALHNSEQMGFTNGVLEVYRHLGIHFYEMGDYSTSVAYLKKCMDMASEKSNLLYVNSVRPYLISDYAHLGQFAEMSKELGLYTDNYEHIVSESNELDEELARLSDDAEGLLRQYESQSEQLQTLQSQRDHYRLAFFGLMAISLFIVVLFLAYKIVRKKRAKV